MNHRGIGVWRLLCALLVVVVGCQWELAHSAEDRPTTDAGMAEGIIIKWRTERAGVALNSRLVLADGVARSRAMSLRYERPGALGVHVLKLDGARPASEVEALARAIAAADSDVEYAEPDRILHPAFIPNDTFYGMQWHYFESTAGINLPTAWDVSTGTGIRVAVLDTGFRPHADLVPNILPGYDFITDLTRANDGNGRDADATDPGNSCGSNPANWHGTHVAGTIAAASNNGIGVAGVAFNAGIVPVRVLGVCGGVTSDIADAIVWASGGVVSGVPINPHPAHVLNLSFGAFGECGSTLENAIASARSRNSLVVASAGNESTFSNFYHPGHCPGVTTVVAVDRGGNRASYSNFGSEVEIAAPGGETGSNPGDGVLSTYDTGTFAPGSDTYIFAQGTSMAAPHVSGVAALALASYGAVPPEVLEDVLRTSARPFPGSCSQCGSGIVDAAGAVAGMNDLLHSATLTQGSSGSAKGYKAGTYGSLSPATMSNGLTIMEIRDQLLFSYVKISGFSSNPGSGWLVSTTAKGKTMQDVGTYSYSGGTATWTYGGTFGFGGSGTTSAYIVHK